MLHTPPHPFSSVPSRPRQAETQRGRSSWEASPAFTPASPWPPPQASLPEKLLDLVPQPSCVPPTLSGAHPSTLPWCRSPWAGETLWTGRVAGETPASASVTAEAGKLPTLNVRPFWPFQVAESGL